MRITLVQATENIVNFLADIASICYGHEKSKNPDKLVKHLFKNGHYSVFEHAYYTWRIEDISRACLAQLTRHRHASFTVRSQRYCDESFQDAVVPKDILKNKLIYNQYQEFLATVNILYQQFIDKGIKKEDARFILPQATETDMYMSCNLRELIHINNLRNSKQAQWEIRELTQDMVRLVVEHSPGLEFMFKDE